MNNLSLDIKNDRLLTQQELAELFKVTVRTIQRKKKSGNLPVSVFINGKELFPSSHINKFISEQNPHLLNNDDVLNAAAAVIKGTSK